MRRVHNQKVNSNSTVEVPHPYTAPDTGDDTPDDNPPIALQVLHLGRAPDPHEDQDEDPAMPVAQLSLHLSQPYQQLPHLHLSLLPAPLALVLVYHKGHNNDLENGGN